MKQRRVCSGARKECCATPHPWIRLALRCAAGLVLLACDSEGSGASPGAGGSPQNTGGAAGHGGLGAGGHGGGGDGGTSAAGPQDGGAGEGGSGGTPDCLFRWERGHGDVFVEQAGGRELGIRLRAELETDSGERLHDPSDVCIIVPAKTYLEVAEFGGRPPGEAWEFLGVPEGQAFWYLPELAAPEVPWLGVSTESVAAGRYTGDEIRLELLEVRGPPGAQVTTYFSDQPPTPLFVPSRDRRTISLGTGTHLHMNWSFSEPGTYRWTLQAQGTRAEDGEREHSVPAAFTFLVEAIGP